MHCFITAGLLEAERVYCIDFLGQKINLSGISPAKCSRSGPNLVYVDMSRVTAFGNFGCNRPIFGKMGLGRVPWSEFFLFGKPCDLSATLQWPIFTKFGHETYFGVPSWNPERHFRKFSL